MYQRTYELHERLDEHPVSYIIGACQATGGFDVGVQLCCAPSRYCWYLLSSLDPNCSLEMIIVFFSRMRSLSRKALVTMVVGSFCSKESVCLKQPYLPVGIDVCFQMVPNLKPPKNRRYVTLGYLYSLKTYFILVISVPDKTTQSMAILNGLGAMLSIPFFGCCVFDTCY